MIKFKVQNKLDKADDNGKLRLIFCFVFAINLVFACTSSSNSNSKPSIIEEKAIPVMQSFFDSIKAGGYKIALVNLLKTNKNIDLEDSMTLILKKRFENLNESAGRYKSYNILRKKP